MKLTTIIILAACLHSSANGLAQNTVTISGKEVSLEFVFNAIKKQTSYRFFFNTNTIQQTTKVTIDVKNAPIEQVMTLALKDQPLTFAIKGRTIFIMKKLQEDKSSQQMIMSGDPVTISGRVVDDKGQPLVGANVKVKGGNTGVTTDNQGRFTLTNVDPNAVLEISFVGHETQTLSVKGRTVFTVALGQKTGTLDETVVIAYGTSSRRFTTGNIGTVKAADIEKQPVQNPLLALQGRVPGIEVTQLTGVSGGGVTVRIQGRNSIKSGLDPLIVVDGMPFPTALTGSNYLESGMVQGGSPLNYINPSDIESIEVLKDADATAIYGSRAANGAILITTKKGKAGRAKLNLNLQQGWGKVGNKVDMLDTRQYLDMRYEAFRHDGILWTSPSISANDLKVWDTTRYTDWQKELIGGTAQYSNVNATISGGANTITYLVGATYNRQTTVYPGDFDDKKGNVHFNLNGASNNQLFKVQVSGSYMIDENRLPGTELTKTAILMEPNAPALYAEDGTLNWETDAAGKSTWRNPLVYTLSQDFKNTTRNLVSSINLSYRIVKGVEIRSNFGYNNLQTQLYLPNRIEFNSPETRSTAQRSASWGNRNMSSWIIEPMLQYNTRLGKAKIDGLLGSTIQQTNNSYLGVTGVGFQTDGLMKNLTAAKSTVPHGSTTSIVRYNALFGRLGFNYDDKYLVNLTARRDGSNKFGDKNKFNNFGSIGVGWIFSQEKWFNQRMPLISFGKLRTSYGVTGNDQIAEFSYLSIYNINNPTVLYQNTIGLDAANIPNPYLQWERTEKWQGGIDLGIWQDRALIGVTYARNRSSNQLVNYVLPSLAGFYSIVKNLPARVQNTSWEFTLTTENIKTKYFEWTTNANLTIPRNKLLSFPGIEVSSFADGMTGVIIGQPLGIAKVTKYGGINSANGMHVLKPNSGFVNVSPVTIYYGGLNNRIVYRGIQLDVLVQFVRKRGKRDFFWSSSMYPGMFSAGSSNQPVSVLNHWQKPGDDAPIPPYSTSEFSIGVNSTDAIYSLDASFVRLKNVSLSWQLPMAWSKKARIQSAQIYFQGQNLGVNTNYLGMDPESGATNLPPLQLWTSGIRLEL